MEIHLKNIGIVKDSSVALDGLTIITGANNSGKSTVGKALYSILEGAKNAPETYSKDRFLFAASRLQTIHRELNSAIFSALSSSAEAKINSILEELDTVVESAKSNDYQHCIKITNDIQISLRQLKEQNDFFEEDIKSTDTSSHIRLKQFVRDPFSSAYVIKKIDKISELLHELTTNIDNQHSIHDYITYRIAGFLTREFKGQIQFTPSKSELSSLKLGNKLELSLDITLQNNTIQTNKESFRGTPFDKVYLIDNPYIIDTIRHKIEDKQSISEFSLSSNKTSDYFQDLKIEEHAQQLLKSIKVDILQSSFEDINIKEKYANLLKILNQVVPGELTFKESGDRDLYYFHHGEYLNASNLATGMKSFAIIKLLLRQQCLDSDTMLILDEPESHLHPAWQNLYAELITLLVKEHQVNILLTTHSANFVLALEAAMYKHQLGDVSNFYRTSKCNERQVQYDLANEISFIYDDLIEHFAQAKILRDQYAESYPLS